MTERSARQTPPDESGPSGPAAGAPLQPPRPDEPSGAESAGGGADDPAIPDSVRLRAIPLVHVDAANRAGFGARLAAAAIDALILIAAAVVLLVLFWVFGNGVVPLSWAAGRQAPGTFALYWILVAVMVLGYNFLTVAAGGRTLGQQTLGLMVVRQDGTALTVRDSAIRVGGLLLSTLALGLGFLAILWDKNCRAWHDKIAGTDVVSLDEG